MGTPVIVGTGLISPLGLGVVEHCFYTRAAVAAPPPAAFETGDGERVEALHCGFLGGSLRIADRLGRLSEVAAHQALVPWETARGTGGVALAFVGPGRPVSAASGAEDELVGIAAARKHVARRARASVVQSWSGAAGAFAALSQARSWLDGGQVSAVLLVAVDSHISAPALSGFLERQDSVFCPRTPPPSEGAAALLLTSQETARSLGLDGARVLASGTAVGQGNDDDEAILDGRALTSLLDALPPPRIDLVAGQEQVDDLRTRDWFLAYARTGKRFAENPALVTLEEETGHLGAAAGAAALAFGVGLLRHRAVAGLGRDATLLAWAISSDGTRGVALVRGGEAAAPTASFDGPRGPALAGSRDRLGPIEGARVEGDEGELDEEPSAEPPRLDAIAGLPDAMAGANDDLPEAGAGAAPGAMSVRIRKGLAAPVSLATSYEEITAACLDGIALAARHRMTLRRDRRGREEERILAFTDALLVTPRFVPLLGRWWEEAVELPDPWKVWAPVFVLGCLEGDDVPAGLGHLLRTLPEDEAEAAVLAGEALATSRYAGWSRLADALARDAHPPARAAALYMNSIAGGPSVGAILGALVNDPSRTVRWAAARAAARAPEDGRIDEALRAEVHRATDAEHLWEVLRALALRGHATGYHAMRHDPGLVTRLGGRALDVLALFGDAADAPLARQVAARCGLTSRVLSGLGHYGHPGAAPLLIRALGDEDLADEASEALVWIFGLPFGEDEVESPAAWKSWLRTTSFPEDARLRFGKPYSPACIAEVAEEGSRSQQDIAWMVDEAHVRCGVPGAPDLSGWSPHADAVLARTVATLGREAALFWRDPWRSETRSRRRSR